jgi:hypothetical protein
MSLYISAQIATERHADLIRAAAGWRRRREARKADQSQRVHVVQAVQAARAVQAVQAVEAVAVYCHRAAAQTMRVGSAT